MVVFALKEHLKKIKVGLKQQKDNKYKINNN